MIPSGIETENIRLLAYIIIKISGRRIGDGTLQYSGDEIPRQYPEIRQKNFLPLLSKLGYVIAVPRIDTK
jgi:hypothetical protein